MYIKTLIGFGLGMMYANEDVRNKVFKVGSKMLNQAGKQTTQFIKQNYSIDVNEIIDNAIKLVDDKQ